VQDRIHSGSPWENGYVESFNGKFRDELLNRELFLSIDELRYVVNRRHMDYNHYRLHSLLGNLTPAKESNNADKLVGFFA